jgi:hypothetical protein
MPRPSAGWLSGLAARTRTNSQGPSDQRVGSFLCWPESCILISVDISEEERMPISRAAKEHEHTRSSGAPSQPPGPARETQSDKPPERTSIINESVIPKEDELGTEEMPTLKRNW